MTDVREMIARSIRETRHDAHTSYLDEADAVLAALDAAGWQCVPKKPKGERLTEVRELTGLDGVSWHIPELVGEDAMRALLAERDDLQRTFDMTWAAQQRAIKEWQAQHDEPLTWPDHAKLVTWLLEERDALREALEGMIAAFGDRDGNLFSQRFAVNRARKVVERKP